MKTPYDYNKDNRYSNIDQDPYFLLFESTTQNNLGKLHYMSISKIMFTKFNINCDEIINITKAGSNRVKVEFKNLTTANNILNSKNLQLNSLRAYIPETVLYRKGVIKNVDQTLSTEEIGEVIQTDITIKHIRRITRRIENYGEQITSNTTTVVLTFRGQKLPEYVSIYGAKCKVAPYTYKVTQCEKCFRFGHIKRQCRSNERCLNCGQNHGTTGCPEKRRNEPFCINFNGAHSVNDKSCPTFITQKRIKSCMAQHNIGYKDAKNLYQSFAEVTSYSATNTDFPLLNNRFQVLDTQPEQEIINYNYPTSLTRPKRPLQRQHIPENLGNTMPSTSGFNDKPPQNKENNLKPNNNRLSKSIWNPYRPQPHLETGRAQNLNQNLNYNTEQSFKNFFTILNFSPKTVLILP